LLGASIEDVEDPVQSSLVAFGLHIGTNMIAVDVWCLGDIADSLCGVFLEVLLSAWVDQVDLQIRGLSFGSTAVGHVPAVNVIVA
jgi:hypothetical protein